MKNKFRSIFILAVATILILPFNQVYALESNSTTNSNIIELI